MVNTLIYSNPNSVLLLDEPDAHLEFIRQRSLFRLINDKAVENNNQIIIASHSEVLLNESAHKIAFLKKPIVIEGRGSQLLKSLKDIEWKDYYLSEQQGWILYLEGSTDLNILTSFAERANHSAYNIMNNAFVKYVGNHPNNAKEHFFGLKESNEELVGIGIFDSDTPETEYESGRSLSLLKWKKYEIENYLLNKETLLAYAGYEIQDKDISLPLFSWRKKQYRIDVMTEAIEKTQNAYLISDNIEDIFSPDVKASKVLDSIFREYFRKLNLYNIMDKSNFNILAKFVPNNLIDPEIIEKLDEIVKTTQQANTG